MLKTIFFYIKKNAAIMCNDSSGPKINGKKRTLHSSLRLLAILAGLPICRIPSPLRLTATGPQLLLLTVAVITLWVTLSIIPSLCVTGLLVSITLQNHSLVLNTNKNTRNSVRLPPIKSLNIVYTEILHRLQNSRQEREN